MKRWNVVRTVSVDVIRTTSWTDEEGRTLPESIVEEMNRLVSPADRYEIEIEFRSKGCSDPGSLSGPPERCHPPEVEDERWVVSATLIAADGHPIGPMSDELLSQLYDSFASDIEAAEIELD